MSGKFVPAQTIYYEQFVNRENAFRHHSYEEDMLQYDLLRRGDPQALAEAKRMFAADEQGRLSSDPVQNMKYLFVASAALASRAALSGGMERERCYNASDLYIRRMDRCRTVGEIEAVHQEMFEFYTRAMASLDREKAYARPVVQAIDYILANLNRPLRVYEIAERIGLSENYLSTLFHRETGYTISAYIMQKRIETARNMLLHSDYSYAQIALSLGFSSQSHFIKAFRGQTGTTPAQYRRKGA